MECTHRLAVAQGGGGASPTHGGAGAKQLVTLLPSPPALPPTFNVFNCYTSLWWASIALLSSSRLMKVHESEGRRKKMKS